MNKCPSCGNLWEEICCECKQLFKEELEYQKTFGDNCEREVSGLLNVSSGEDVSINLFMECV